jgi:hypothetical protein
MSQTKMIKLLFLFILIFQLGSSVFAQENLGDVEDVGEYYEEGMSEGDYAGEGDYPVEEYQDGEGMVVGEDLESYETEQYVDESDDIKNFDNYAGNEALMTEGQLLQQEGAQVEKLDFEGNTYFEAEIANENVNPVDPNEVYYTDPFTGRKLTPLEYKEFVDTEIDADDSWRVKDKHKIDVDNVLFKGQSFSLIDWKNIDSVNWLDFDNWRANRHFRDKNPDWKLKTREQNNKEMVGKVLSCIGTCHVYRGRRKVNASYLTVVKEGDEVHNLKDSYMWLYLMDGTMVRISPETSVSFNEINVSNQSVFVYARLNQGNILYYPRLPLVYKSSKKEETDSIFLPLKLKEANIQNFLRQKYQKLSNEEKLHEVASRINANAEQTEFLNQKILENFKFGSKKSELILVLPNGTINAENAILDVFVEPGSDSYVRHRDISDQVKQAEEYEAQVFLLFRGYNNKKTVTLNHNTWYSISLEGRDYKAVNLEDHVGFGRAEFSTKRIPTILMARELMYEKYSRKIMKENMTYDDFAYETGYRLWNYVGENDSADKKYEINTRKSFLIEYARRVETSNLRSVFKLLDQMDAEGTLNIEGFSEKYYSKALNAYRESISNKFSDDNDIVKDYKDLQYYIWNITHAKGN